MPSIERSLTIDTPPQKVYEAFVDLSRWLEWNPHFRQIKPLSKGPLEVGSKARVALKLSPFATLWEVTETNPGRSFAWASSSLPGIRLVFDHVAESADGGTRATLRIDFEGPLAFMAGVTGAYYGRNLSRSLAALKRLLEREAPSAPKPQPETKPKAKASPEPKAKPKAEVDKPEPEAKASPKPEAEPKAEVDKPEPEPEASADAESEVKPGADKPEPEASADAESEVKPDADKRETEPEPKNE